MPAEADEQDVEKFAELIATGSSVGAAAEAVGWNRATGFRKLRSAIVRATIAEHVSETWRPLRARIVAELPKAIGTLIDIAGDDKTHPGIRVKAAVELAKLGLRLDAEQFVRIRLAAIEAAMNEPTETTTEEAASE
jgi:hypothetical protein